MRILIVSISALAVALPVSAVAAELTAGSRVVIKAEGRKDYSPRIVECPAESGVCLRDTRNDPPDSPVATIADGQRVDFPSWKISYVFHPDGSGSFLDANGSKVGSFTWSQ